MGHKSPRYGYQTYFIGEPQVPDIRHQAPGIRVSSSVTEREPVEPEPKLFVLINTDCTKVRLEAAKMDKNSFLPPFRHISYVTTAVLRFKEAI